ncbi:hypothetical protein ACFC58_13325 [Kitasatospora purpeofusca]|uniref:hypothetical protein n=1 Tax=Kitasatospora purpeofusca TaxID=67352 RepID=UPI0035D9CF58
MRQNDLTEAQKQAFEQNEADFRNLDDHVRDIRETARARLTANGWEPDSNDTRPCFSCPCPDLQVAAQGKCQRGGCHHPIYDHDLPR